MSLAGLGACSTIEPRPFRPLSQPPSAAAEPAFADAFKGCVDVVTQGTGRVKYNTNVGTIVGASVAAPVAGVTGLALAAGVGVASVAVAPLALFAAGVYGISRGTDTLHRNVKEAEVQEKLTRCMAAKNFTIASWQVVDDGQVSDFTTPVLYSVPR